MKYKELKITFAAPQSEEQNDIIVAELAELGFDSFETESEEVSKAYISEELYGENRSEIEDYLASLTDARCEVSDMPDINWNSVWESNFTPITLNDRCVVRAPFHPVPDVEYDLVIMPKMSFGTGHHATTCLMLEHLLENDIDGLNVLDMGSGTGVLAILAAKRGAAHVDAIDIDEWAAQNAVENTQTNNVADKISVEQGDAALLTGRRYDLILANINRNILLADMQRYTDSLNDGGRLIVSGFLQIDCQPLEQKGSSLGLKTIKETSRDGWYSIVFQKQ